MAWAFIRFAFGFVFRRPHPELAGLDPAEALNDEGTARGFVDYRDLNPVAEFVVAPCACEAGREELGLALVGFHRWRGRPALAPPFTTWIHGDCHPGNLIVRSSPQGVEVKLIDAKLRGAAGADYLIDVGRLIQFLTVTLSVQKPIGTVELVFDDDAATLDYRFEQPVWTDRVVQVCLDRAESFAAAQVDCNWCDRLDLTMAADMLGLIAGRLDAGHGDDPELLIWFGEGLGLLNRFCSRF
jgi:hypothetical protein